MNHIRLYHAVSLRNISISMVTAAFLFLTGCAHIPEDPDKPVSYSMEPAEEGIFLVDPDGDPLVGGEEREDRRQELDAAAQIERILDPTWDAEQLRAESDSRADDCSH